MLVGVLVVFVLLVSVSDAERAGEAMVDIPVGRQTGRHLSERNDLCVTDATRPALTVCADACV